MGMSHWEVAFFRNNYFFIERAMPKCQLAEKKEGCRNLFVAGCTDEHKGIVNERGERTEGCYYVSVGSRTQG